MLTRNSRLLRVAGVMLAVICLIAAIVFIADAERQLRADGSSRDDAEVNSIPQKAVESAAAALRPSAGGLPTQPSGAAESIDWLRRMGSSNDYQQLAREALPGALRGDANAQFMLTLVLMECDMARVRATATARWGTTPERRVPTRQKPDKKCGSADAAEALPGHDPRLKEPRYWLERAVEGGQPEALALHSMYTINGWALTKNDPDHERERQVVESRLRSAVESGSPRALVYVAMAMVAAVSAAEAGEADEVQMRATAWGLLACRSGGCGSELGPFQLDFRCQTEASQDCLSTPDRQLSALQLHFGPDRATQIEELVARLREIVDTKRWSELDEYLDLGVRS